MKLARVPRVTLGQPLASSYSARRSKPLGHGIAPGCSSAVQLLPCAGKGLCCGHQSREGRTWQCVSVDGLGIGGPRLAADAFSIPAIADGDVDCAAAWACTGVRSAAWLWTGRASGLRLLRQRTSCINRQASKCLPGVRNIVVHGGCALVAVYLQNSRADSAGPVCQGWGACSNRMTASSRALQQKHVEGTAPRNVHGHKRTRQRQTGMSGAPWPRASARTACSCHRWCTCSPRLGPGSLLQCERALHLQQQLCSRCGRLLSASGRGVLANKPEVHALMRVHQEPGSCCCRS